MSMCSEEVRKSLDVLDRVLSEFDDIGTDVGDDASDDAQSSPCSVGGSEDVETSEHREINGRTPNETPPPVDRTLKPKNPSPPALPKKNKLSKGSQSDSHSSQGSKCSRGSSSSQGSTDLSHEYQEINSELLGPSAASVEKKTNESQLNRRMPRRQASEDRIFRNKQPAAPRIRRQKSQENFSASSTEVTTLEGHSKNAMKREGPTLLPCNRGRQRERPRDGRYLRKSRSGDVSIEKRPKGFEEDLGHRQGRHPRNRRSRSSERFLEVREQIHSPVLEPPQVDPRLLDPRLVDPRLLDLRMMDPGFLDMRMVDLRMLDPRFHLEEQLINQHQESLRFPHLMNYQPMTRRGPISAASLSPNALSPLPSVHPMDLSPGYPMYPYELGYVPEQMLPHEQFPPHVVSPNPHALVPDFHPAELHPINYPLEYGVEYPVDFLPPSHYPPVIKESWEEYPERDMSYRRPPSPEEAVRNIRRIVRNTSGSAVDESSLSDRRHHDIRNEKARYNHRRLSVGQSDSSERSSPSEEQILRSNQTQDIRRSDSGTSFKVGEMVRNHPRGNLGSSFLGANPEKGAVTSMAAFPSGKDSGFDEVPVTDDLSPGSNGKGRSFIVAGVFNDSSKMYIPAPPSPTPDYDDGNGSDGNDSDILQGSQFDIGGQSKLRGFDNETNADSKRESVSEDSLQGTSSKLNKKPSLQAKGSPMHIEAPRGTPNKTRMKHSKSTKETPLQKMIDKFHKNLPPIDSYHDECQFSDDSLEETSTVPTSKPSTITSHRGRQNSMESLISGDDSTASFDYLNGSPNRGGGIVKSRSSIGIPDLNLANSTSRSRKEDGGRNKRSHPKKNGLVFIPLNDSENERSNSNRARKSPKKVSTKVSEITEEEHAEKFNTIRNMLKEGLIEGLDESPPNFKPPPPAETTENQAGGTEERADSGMGSALSSGTIRTDDSGGSDNHSEKSSSPQGSKSKSSLDDCSRECNNNKNARKEAKKPCMLDTPENIDLRPHMKSTKASSVTEESQTANEKTPSKSSTPTSTRNSSWLHGGGVHSNRGTSRPPPQPPKQPKARDSSAINHINNKRGKITHVDAICKPEGEEVLTMQAHSLALLNGDASAAHYALHDHEDNPQTDKVFLENLKNLEPTRQRPDSLAVISETQDTVSSRGSSRSGRFFSRITDTVRGNKTPTPTSTTTKLTSSSRGSTWIHGDIIRDPKRSSSRLLGTPPKFPQLVSPSTAVPLSRDCSGRFLSIEDLTEAASGTTRRRPDEVVVAGRKKKHSTLPTNLTPADMKREGKELRRTTSLMCGHKGRDEEGSSKFRFNFFKGFWRRKQYSLDKA